MSYKDELQFVAEADDSIFPDFLFEPMFNDHEDKYFEIGISEDPLVKKARSLRKKYSNYFDYLDALHVYYEYIDLLIDKYGSWSVVKNTYKVGLLEDVLPSKPRLKKSRRNKEYLQSGILPSRKIIEEDTSEDFIEASRYAMPDKTGKDVDETLEFNKIDKKTRKMLRKSIERIRGTSRRKNLYSNANNNNGADFIIEYLNQASKGYYDNIGKRKEPSVVELYKEDLRLRDIPEEIIESEMLANTQKYVGGRMIRGKDFEQIEIAKDFYSSGIDIFGNMSKPMNKNAVKMLRQSIGAMDSKPMTKKELKKLKKKQKKEKERLNRQIDNDKTLSNILLNNKFGFEKSGSTLNFRLKDLYDDE